MSARDDLLAFLRGAPGLSDVEVSVAFDLFDTALAEAYAAGERAGAEREREACAATADRIADAPSGVFECPARDAASYIAQKIRARDNGGER